VRYANGKQDNDDDLNCSGHRLSGLGFVQSQRRSHLVPELRDIHKPCPPEPVARQGIVAMPAAGLIASVIGSAARIAIVLTKRAIANTRVRARV